MKSSYLTILVLVFATSALASQADYYWQEYHGNEPHDAVRVYTPGTTKYYYIGQGYFPGAGLLPGMIVPRTLELKAVTNEQVVTIKDNIKILASNSSNIFRWMSINFANLESLDRLDFLELVNGGTQDDSYLYIGGYLSPDYMNVGKISTVAPNQGLILPSPEGKVTVYKNFHVLVLVKLNGKYPQYTAAHDEYDSPEMRNQYSSES